MVAGVFGAMTYHRPVLAREAVEALITDPNGVYVDATYGGGGHSRLILSRLGEKGRLIAIDQDPEAPFSDIEDARFTAVRANFRHLRALLESRGVKAIQGLLVDLGVSSHQLDTPERGFSYRAEGPLDLRMDPTKGLPAYEWLRRQSEESLTRILREYGDLPRAHRLAQALLHRSPQTTSELRAVVEAIYGHKALTYMAQTFQALRIALNDEMSALEELLRAATEVTLPYGRLVGLTYHSGEARRIKALYQTPLRIEPLYGHRHYAWKLLHKQRPSPEEIQENPRSRSATLWVLEKLPL
jgi:16S rRNA (cytosine1402-N4)-methyltransferase